MNYQLSFGKNFVSGDIKLSASKSIHNRILIIKQLCEGIFSIQNPASANDTIKLKEQLEILDEIFINENYTIPRIIDVDDAGTSFRFLTSYICLILSRKKNPENFKITLTGSSRMQERPIGPLVNALRKLGAEIRYVNKENYPPLEISGILNKSNEVEIEGNISSQYITSLLLIAPCLPEGLRIRVNKILTSRPYVEMTLSLMSKFGVIYKHSENTFTIPHQNYSTTNLLANKGEAYFFVEGDWSAASYWYSIVALSEFGEITLRGLKEDSIQGDAIIRTIMEEFGVSTEFISEGIIIRKTATKTPDYFSCDFSNCPDLAQTLIVLCAAQGIKGNFSGLSTLRNKETDRIKAVKEELHKLGVILHEEIDSLKIIDFSEQNINEKIQFKTYDDHRMAMSFAPLVMRYKNLIIENIEVVKKSYPEFWQDLQSLGIEAKE